MKILIVGGTAALSISLIKVLKKEHTVITAGRKNCDIYLDLNQDIDASDFPKDIDTIIHVAASFGGKAYLDFKDAISANVLGILRIAQLSKELNVQHLILLSSMYVCLSVCSPYYTQYALTKKQSEEIALLFAKENNINLTILRPTQIYGNDKNFAKNQPFFYHMLEKAKNGEDIFIYGNHDALRNYIYVDDLNEIISRVVEKKVLGIFYCGTMTDVSYSEIAKSAQLVYGNGGKVKFLKDKEDIPNNIFDKDNALYEIINYYPNTNITKSIENIYKQGHL